SLSQNEQQDRITVGMERWEHVINPPKNIQLDLLPIYTPSGGARDFLLQVLWGCSAFYRGCYKIRVISYVSHGSLLQHLPTISSYLFTCLLSEASLWSMKSAKQIDRRPIIIIIIDICVDTRS